MGAKRLDPLPVKKEGIKSELDDRYHQPTARQCALLMLRVLQAREQETNREVSRARLSQNTIRRLCGRSQIASDFLLEIQEILLAAGWCLFLAGPSYFAIIKIKAIDGWGRISSKRIGEELKSVPRGKYNFENLEPLLLMTEKTPDEEDDKDE